jgi:predicted Zn-dependent peptidase
MFGARTFTVHNKYNQIIRLIKGVLSGGMSGRLFTKLRDELGICYYITSDNDAFTDHGFFSVSTGVDSKRVKEAVNAIIQELKRLTVEIVSKDELDKVKQYLIGNINLGLESSDAVASFIGEQEVLREKPKNSDEIIKEIKGVTAEEIKFVAERIFRNESLNLAIVGKFKDKDEFLDILKF